MTRDYRQEFVDEVNAAADELDRTVADWRRVLGLNEDNNPKETP